MKLSVVSLLALLALTLSACVSVPSRGYGAVGAWEHRQLIQEANHWEVKAKVGSNLGASGGRATWKQQDERFDVRISGPLGIGAVDLRGTPQQVEVKSRKGNIVTADPESTMRELLGWSLPIANARYWLVGMPGPDRRARAWYDKSGLMVRLEQGDWRIEYPEYQQVGRYRLPRRILLQQGDLKLKMVLADWRVL